MERVSSNPFVLLLSPSLSVALFRPDLSLLPSLHRSDFKVTRRNVPYVIFFHFVMPIGFYQAIKWEQVSPSSSSKLFAFTLLTHSSRRSLIPFSFSSPPRLLVPLPPAQRCQYRRRLGRCQLEQARQEARGPLDASLP